MKLINNSKYNLSHEAYSLATGKILDVPEYVAALWLKFNGISKYSPAEDVEHKEEKVIRETVKEVKTSKAKTKAKKK